MHSGWSPRGLLSPQAEEQPTDDLKEVDPIKTCEALKRFITAQINAGKPFYDLHGHKLGDLDSVLEAVRRDGLALAAPPGSIKYEPPPTERFCYPEDSTTDLFAAAAETEDLPESLELP